MMDVILNKSDFFFFKPEALPAIKEWDVGCSDVILNQTNGSLQRSVFSSSSRAQNND